MKPEDDILEKLKRLHDRLINHEDLVTINQAIANIANFDERLAIAKSFRPMEARTEFRS